MRGKIFVVKCPKCGKEQPWNPRRRNIAGLMKQCTRCEKAFVVHKNINESQIIGEYKDGKI